MTNAELANRVVEAVWYQGAIAFDTTKSNGTPRKMLEASTRYLGWAEA